MNIQSTSTLRRGTPARGRSWSLVAVGLGTLLALGPRAAVAQSVLEFDLWMQRIDRHSQSVLRNITRHDADAAQADARALAHLYQQMEHFYERRDDAADAVLASYVGKDHAEAVELALAHGEFEQAFQQASDLARDCNNCHLQFKPLRK